MTARSVSRRTALMTFGAAALGSFFARQQYDALIHQAQTEILEMKRRMVRWSSDQKPADAIVVFTGSRNRVPAALSLWQPGQSILITSCDLCQSKRGLILGTGQMHIPENAISIDYDATHTMGNAAYVAQALNERPDITSLTLVTEEMHGPRSWYYLEKFLPPGIRLDFFPVQENRTSVQIAVEEAKLLRQKIAMETGKRTGLLPAANLIPREDSLYL